MERLGKNHGGYHGETIDIHAVLRDIKAAGQQHGWTLETFGQQGQFELFALRRPAAFINHLTARIYLSTGIHGDEPAGPLAALRLLQENRWPEFVDLWFCPCLNPTGFTLNRRENAGGVDLNRDYRNPQTGEISAHIRWLEQQPIFNFSLCLHEDWESHGFYVYELNPDGHPSLAGRMVKAVAPVCPIDLSPLIEGREAREGIINPNLDPASRPQWPEAFWLIQNKTRQSCTLEAPSDFSLPLRVNALVAGVNAALEA